MVLPFSTLYFSHVLSALLGVRGVRAVLARARRARSDSALARARRPARGPRDVVCEYPLAIAARWSACTRSRAAAAASSRRALAYGGGAASASRRCSPTSGGRSGRRCTSSYADAVAETGVSGHDVLGLNDGGFFGITLPRLGDGARAAVRGRGLLTLAPVLVMAIVGLVADAPLGPARRGAHDHRGRARLPRLQRRLLAAVRRRLAGPALPDPDPPVPRRSASARRGGAGPRRRSRWPRSRRRRWSPRR